MFKSNFLEFNRFGIISMLLIIQAAMGGLAAGFGGINDTLVLSVLVVGTILSQSFILACAPMKFITSFSSAVILINTLIFLWYMFI